SQLFLHNRDVRVQHLARQQLSLGRFPTRIADGTRCPARHRDWIMPQQLEPPKPQQWHQVPDVQAVRRRVEPAVQRDWPRCEPLEKDLFLRAIGHQSAPFQFRKNAHPRAVYLSELAHRAKQLKLARLAQGALQVRRPDYSVRQHLRTIMDYGWLIF